MAAFFKTCERELESLLLRMYNDASQEKVHPTSKSTPPTMKGSDVDKSQCPEDQNMQECSNANNNNIDGGQDACPVPVACPGPRYAVELEELLQTEQTHRVALLKQAAAHREQVYLAWVSVVVNMCKQLTECADYFLMHQSEKR